MSSMPTAGSHNPFISNAKLQSESLNSKYAAAVESAQLGMETLYTHDTYQCLVQPIVRAQVDKGASVKQISNLDFTS